MPGALGIGLSSIFIENPTHETPPSGDDMITEDGVLMVDESSVQMVTE